MSRGDALDSLVANLSAASYHVLIAGQLLDTHRTACVEFGRTDADFGAHAELPAVGKLRRGIMKHDGAVDLLEKPLRGCRVIGDDALGMLGAISRHVSDRRGNVIDHAYRDDGVEIFA